MKKKGMLLILTAALTLSALSAVGLTACDGGGELTHEHSYTEEIVAPTCTEEGYTVHTCSCGNSYKDNYTDMIEHDYLDGVCKYCGELKDALQLSLSDDGTSYIVSGFVPGASEVVIPSSYRGLPVTSIGVNTFENCRGVTSVTIPDSVTSIEYSAFAGCRGLESVTIPDSVNSIGDYAFNTCTGLTSVVISDGVTSIGERAFSA